MLRLTGPASVLRVSGNFESVKEIRDFPIRVGDRTFRVGDVGEVHRGFNDPAAPRMRFMGEDALGIAVSMKSGGDILVLGEALEKEFARLQETLPAGMQLSKVSDQPAAVKVGVGEFVRVLAEALVIVLLVSFFSLGMRTGMVVALSIPLVLAMTFFVMHYFDIGLHKISLGALVLALLNRRLNWDLTRQAVQSAARLSCFVIFILIGSTVFSLIFRGINGDLWVEHLLTALPGGQLGFLIAVNLLFFVLAFFLDFFELAFILIPLVGPVASKLGIDLIWFGVLLSVNMQTSFMHPPFGFALFYLRSVAPKEVKTSDIYWGAVPFVLIQVIMVGLIIGFPNLVSTNKAAQKNDNLQLHITPSAEEEQTPVFNLTAPPESTGDNPSEPKPNRFDSQLN